MTHYDDYDSGYGRARYRDRDRDGYRSSGYSSRSRSRSRSRRRRERSPSYGGEPSREVKLNGLHPEITEDDITAELEKYYNVEYLEDVRVIRDKKTGNSRGFAFICFPDLESSAAFVHDNYPHIRIDGPRAANMDRHYGKHVSIAFSAERSQQRKEQSWTCAILNECAFTNDSFRMSCRSCDAPKPDSLPENENEVVAVGDTDVSNDPTPFVLVRSLQPRVTEQLLANGIAKLYRSAEKQAHQPSSKSDSALQVTAATTSAGTIGATEGSIKRAFIIRDRRSNRSQGFGLIEFHSVEDAQAALKKYDTEFAGGQFTIASRPVFLSYIHNGVFNPATDRDRNEHTFIASHDPSLRLKYWNPKLYAGELVISENPPAPALGAIVKKRKAEDTSPAPPPPPPPAPTLTAVRAPQITMLWAQKSNELRARGAPPSQPVSAAEKEATPDPEQYTGTTKRGKPGCFLCSRVFETQDELKAHVGKEVHIKTLKNKEKVAAAVATMERMKGPQAAEKPTTYRDRAAERRAANNQPMRPNVVAPSSAVVKERKEKREKEEKETPPAPSAAQKMMSKLGWKEGEGLGAEGSGVTEAIKTSVYLPGVGLGAEGAMVGDAAEEAAKNTVGGFAAYLESGKDKARDRFKSLD